MKTVDLHDVKRTVEEIRSERYQSISSSLVNEILNIEERYVESDTDALSKVREVVEKSLSRGGK